MRRVRFSQGFRLLWQQAQKHYGEFLYFPWRLIMRWACCELQRGVAMRLVALLSCASSMHPGHDFHFGPLTLGAQRQGSSTVLADHWRLHFDSSSLFLRAPTSVVWSWWCLVALCRKHVSPPLRGRHGIWRELRDKISTAVSKGTGLFICHLSLILQLCTQKMDQAQREITGSTQRVMPFATGRCSLFSEVSPTSTIPPENLE